MFAKTGCYVLYTLHVLYSDAISVS